jgi:hypothetical protein
LNDWSCSAKKDRGRKKVDKKEEKKYFQIIFLRVMTQSSGAETVWGRLALV